MRALFIIAIVALMPLGVAGQTQTDAPDQPQPQTPAAEPAAPPPPAEPEPATDSPAPTEPEPGTDSPAPAEPEPGTGSPAPAAPAPEPPAQTPAQTGEPRPSAADQGTTQHQPEQSPQVIYQPLGGTPEKQAEEGDWDPWDHPEAFGGYDHTGFFLRLSLGLGGGNITGEADPAGGEEVTFSGAGLASDIAIGGSVTPSLAIHLDLFWSFVLNASADGGPYEGTDFEFDGDVNMQGTGVGLTYHIMPINLYVSAAGGLGSIAWERAEGSRNSTRLGFATNVMVGKEWWVDPQWGIGIAGQFMFVTASDRAYDHVNAMAFNLLFSATYN